MSQPTPQEERARECANLVLECCADMYEHGRKSEQPAQMANSLESATQKILAFHAHARAEEAEKNSCLLDNPYPKDSPEHNAWADGFKYAVVSNLPNREEAEKVTRLVEAWEEIDISIRLNFLDWYPKLLSAVNALKEKK